MTSLKSLERIYKEKKTSTKRLENLPPTPSNHSDIAIISKNTQPALRRISIIFIQDMYHKRNPYTLSSDPTKPIQKTNTPYNYTIRNNDNPSNHIIFQQERMYIQQQRDLDMKFTPQLLLPSTQTQTPTARSRQLHTTNV